MVKASTGRDMGKCRNLIFGGANLHKHTHTFMHTGQHQIELSRWMSNATRSTTSRLGLQHNYLRIRSFLHELICGGLWFNGNGHPRGIRTHRNSCDLLPKWHPCMTPTHTCQCEKNTCGELWAAGKLPISWLPIIERDRAYVLCDVSWMINWFMFIFAKMMRSKAVITL